jgi:predicted peptidase
MGFPNVRKKFFLSIKSRKDRMKKIVVMLCLIVPFIASAQLTVLTAKRIKAANGQYIGFYQSVPPGWSTSTTKYPVIVFLHGIGERGNGTTELSRVKSVAIPRYISQKTRTMRYYVNGKWQTFVVVCPQLSSSYGSWQNFYVDEMINYAIKYLKGDPNRIILTGLSLGGGGVWKYASSSSTNASKLAAIVPICGSNGMVNASYIATHRVATWAFHSINDPRIPYSYTKAAVSKINALSPLYKALLKSYTEATHSIWDRAYDQTHTYQNPHVFEWMLKQNKALSPTAVH